MIPFEQADSITLNTKCKISTEEINLHNSIRRILAKDTYSDFNFPPFYKLVLNNFAIKKADINSELEIIKTMDAGQTPKETDCLAHLPVQVIDNKVHFSNYKGSAQTHALSNFQSLIKIKQRVSELKKGDMQIIAKIASIQAGEKTSELIPLCHPLMIINLEVKAYIDNTDNTCESFTKCSRPIGIKWKH